MARNKPPRRLLRRFVTLVIAALAVFLGLAIFRAGQAPTIAIEPALPGIGPRTAVQVRVSEPARGLGRVTVELVQGPLRETLVIREETPREFYAFWGPRTAEATLDVEVGREVQSALEPGEATIRVTASRASTPLRHPDPAVQELTLPVRLVPPTIAVLSDQVNVAQGGSGAVAYRPGQSAVRHGVEIGERWFPGEALPGDPEAAQFALFGVPFDHDDATTIRLVAEDELGNRATTSFVNRFTPRPPRRDTIPLSDNFMAKVVPAILSQTPSVREEDNLLATYLKINGDLRRANLTTLDELAATSRSEFLWQGPFLQLPGSQVMATFAETRTYTYQGRPVDEQTHLGFDLASTKKAEVPAAAAGTVVLADYFGIYGNAVAVDHGFGLMTLYGHLSSIAVSQGQTVARGEALGRTGATGLAGGDHLHFEVLVRGVSVDPIEWWDPRWLETHLRGSLGDALP